MSLMNIDAKIINKIKQTESNNTLKASYIMINWDLSQGCKDSSISSNQLMINHINKLKNKNHIIISIDAEKAFDKIQHPFMIKIILKVGIEGTYPNIKKPIYDKPRANVILHDEKLSL